MYARSSKPNKKKIISRIGGYHGTSAAAGSLTGIPVYHKAFDLPFDGILHTSCPNFWKFGNLNESEEEFTNRMVKDLEDLILKEGPDTIGGFIAEPVMGTGGVIVPTREYYQRIQSLLKEHDILFMVGGAFEGMTDLLMKRVHKDNYSLGFKQTPDNKISTQTLVDSVRHQINPDDLMEFGFITEFVGRLPVIVTLDELTKEDLVRILTEPKNAFVEQYKALFKMDEVNLNFSEEALQATAEKAIEQKTGARGLRSILESTLMEVMFELPELKDITHCTVEADAITGEAPVKLSKDGGEIIELSKLEQRSA